LAHPLLEDLVTTPDTDALDIRGGVLLPAIREDVELRTGDGLTLVGELSLPADREPVGTIVALHPLPTAGGFMDSHVIRKAAARLPALADLAVLRFNFRADLAAAVAFVRDRGLPTPWLVGWSFGTEVALKHGLDVEVVGVVLLSPPLHRTSDAELEAWHGSGRPVVAVVPEFDDYLRPDEARRRFALVPEAEVVAVEGGKHLWVGEKQTSRVLTEIVGRVAPGALPLPSTWPPRAS
jgi:alpha/beta superfamily hydrolase